MTLTLVGATRVLLLRNYLSYKSAWLVFLTGFLEPVFYLFSIGVGVGKLIDSFEVNGHSIPYAEFVAPGMLAASAMNGAILDSTFNMFFKLKFQKLFDQMLATPMTTTNIAVGELSWCLLRSGLYSAAFLVVMVAMGLTHSWLAVLALPAALLIGFAVAAVGMALTSFMRSWQDFEFITLATMPMFLFSATFFPITAYGSWAWIVQLSPLYHGVALVRAANTGVFTVACIGHVLVLLAIAAVGMTVAARRLGKLLLS